MKIKEIVENMMFWDIVDNSTGWYTIWGFNYEKDEPYLWVTKIGSSFKYEIRDLEKDLKLYNLSLQKCNIGGRLK